MNDNEKFKLFCDWLNDECRQLQNSEREIYLMKRHLERIYI